MFKLRGGRFTLSTTAVKVAEPLVEKKEPPKEVVKPEPQPEEVEIVQVVEVKPQPQIVQEVEIPSFIAEKEDEE